MRAIISICSIWAMLAMLVLATSCTNPRAVKALENTPKEKEVAEVKEPISDVEALVANNSRFAFELYHALAEKKEGNLFFSPFSISTALAMVWEGARGETASEIASALHFKMEPKQLHEAFKEVNRMISSREELPEEYEASSFKLNMANAIWTREGSAVLPEYVEFLHEYYQAEARELDFTNKPEQSRNIINEWVKERTEDKISELIPRGFIHPLIRMVVTNAIYFKASWAEDFPVENTSEGDFHLLNRRVVKVPMMFQAAFFDYFETETYQALILPYEYWQAVMIVILPKEGHFHEVEAELSLEMVNKIQREAQTYLVYTFFPKFTIESDFMLSETLAGMGMRVPFTSEADFSGITGKKELLFIDEIIHKAWVGVDEKGTEAAGATAVLLAEGDEFSELETKEFKADRPFIFLIKETSTNTILFGGRVMNPAS